MSASSDPDPNHAVKVTEPYKLLVELQAQIIAVTRQNKKIEQTCLNLRDELWLRKAPAFRTLKARQSNGHHTQPFLNVPCSKLLKSHSAAMP
jgi:hypothetical protein